ncbi:MAG: hypothetical protein DWQ10_07875 [Calditrichaeota bacterium]|nr:MAG: hypothetical protein DWQ10_07875 [Calditrichota bacterium]
MKNRNRNRAFRILGATLLILFCGSCKHYSYNNPVDPNFALDPPRGLRIQAARDTQIILSWDQPTASSLFEIKRKKNTDSAYTILDSVNGRLNGFIDYSGIETDVLYTYALTAGADENVSDTITQDFALPFPKPTNLQLEKVDDRLIKLTWEQNAYFAIWVRVERKIDDSEYELIGQVARHTSDFFDSFTEYNRIYSYRVYAKTSINASDYSEVVSFMPTPPDSN